MHLLPRRRRRSDTLEQLVQDTQEAFRAALSAASTSRAETAELKASIDGLTAAVADLTNDQEPVGARRPTLLWVSVFSLTIVATGIAWVGTKAFADTNTKDIGYSNGGYELYLTGNVDPKDLAANLPAPILADLLGVHIATAVRWTKYAKRDWHAYLAGRREAED